MFLTSTRIIIMVSRTLVDGYFEKRRISAKDLADYHRVNLRTLQQALGMLVQARILDSKVGGINRGYILNRHPSSISVHDITLVLQGDLEMHCTREIVEGIRCDITDCDNCLMFNKFQGVAQKIKDTATDISLLDIYKNHQQYGKE